MSSKTYILERVKQNKPMQSPLPEVPIFERKDVSLVPFFRENLEFVGGRLIELKSKEELNGQIAEIYPDLKVIASTLPDITSASFDLNSIVDPHELKGIDLAIIKGEFGVAENGAIWIPSNTIFHRALPFITQHLVIVLDKSTLVWNMHQAYQKLDIQKSDGFGVFLSGPSKTADIEQSLVIGAHGSRSLVVFLV